MSQQFKGDDLEDSPGLVMTLRGSKSDLTKPELTRQEKTRQFWIGFLGWWLVNVPVWALFGGGYGMIGLITFPANLIVLLFLAFSRRWAALGMLAAIAANLLISVMLGIMYNGLCFIPFLVEI